MNSVLLWIGGLLVAVLGLLFAAALAIRLGHVAEIRNTVTFESPVVDAMVYDRTARAVVDQGLSALELPFYQPPLYPLLLAAVYASTGGSYVVPRILQAVAIIGPGVGSAQAERGVARNGLERQLVDVEGEL